MSPHRRRTVGLVTFGTIAVIALIAGALVVGTAGSDAAPPATDDPAAAAPVAHRTPVPGASGLTRYLDPVFSDVTVTTDVVYGEAVNFRGQMQQLLMDIFEPEGDTETNRPVVFWVHGGGFTEGEKSMTADWGTDFARRGYVAISIDYRLRPGNYFDFANPADPQAQNAVRDAVHDGQAAVRYVRAHAADLKIDPARIAMGGGSAGAVLSLGVALFAPETGAGGSPGYSSRICLAAPTAGALVPEVIDSRDAPAVFFHGELDPRIPIAYARSTEAAMRDAGLFTRFFAYPGVGHAVGRERVMPDLVPILFDRVVNGTCPDQTYAPGSGFHPIAPTRIIDTRSGLGTQRAPFRAGEQREIAVTGRSGVPTTGVSGAVLNVTVESPSTSSHLSVWPTLFTAPVASNLNYARGQTVANQVVVGTGSGGTVSVRNNAGSVQVIIDLVGWFDMSGTGDRFTATTPTRVLDTRSNVGLVGSFGPGQLRSLRIAGTNGVPSDATAVVMTLTSVGATDASHLTAWPSGTDRPMASNLNVVPGRTVPNMVTVGVGRGAFEGEVSIFNNSGSTDVLADVVGWYVPAGTTGVFTATSPTRIVDTRVGIGGATVAYGPGEVRSYVGVGQAGVPPEGASAVVLNVTVDQPSGATHLTVFPSGADPPNTSNLNVQAGRSVANLTVVGLGADHRFSVRNNSGQAHVIVDVVGYYSGS